MNNLHIFDLWYIKLLFGVILTLFAPVQTSIMIIFFMVLIDTITEAVCAVKSKRFNSRTLKRSLKKVIIYCTCILTIRLVEIGIFINAGVVMLTQIMAGFLIVTEAISILENLTILGLPIPAGFLDILFKQIRIGLVEEVLKKAHKEKKEISDIEDILYLQVPTIKSDNTRRFLELKFEAWIQVAKEIIKYFDSIADPDNDLIYYKVLSIIKLGFGDGDKSWEDEEISCKCIEPLNKCLELRIEEWFEDVKEICYRVTTPAKKKNELIRKFTILFYQTVLDAQKCEMNNGSVENFSLNT